MLKMFTHTDFLKPAMQKGDDLLMPTRQKKRGSTTSLWTEHAPKNTLNLKNQALLANKATVYVSSKILYMNL